jgi:predicted TIM-barrel fold metal-dependent hydrolase
LTPTRRFRILNRERVSEMQTSTELLEAGVAGAPTGLVDGCAFHAWRSTEDLVRYMDEAWYELLMRPNDPAGAANLRGGWQYGNPGAASNLAALSVGVTREVGAVAASDPDEVAASLPANAERVVLGYDTVLASTVFPMPYVTREVMRAVNDWTSQEWLKHDDRFYGMVLVSTLMPTEAAAEIRRAGQDLRMVAVALGCNGLGRPFGDPAYLPVIEAAAELDLPLVVQVGSDGATGVTTAPLGGGPPATVAEYRALGGHSQMTHVASLIIGGVFDRFPNLKVLLVGGGAAWAPSLAWSMDYGYRGRQHTVPWMKRLPSEYFADHVRISTCSLERVPSREALAQALGVLPMSSMLVYTSCTPGLEAANPDEVADRLPEDWHHNVFSANAEELFRWPSS